MNIYFPEEVNSPLKIAPIQLGLIFTHCCVTERRKVLGSKKELLVFFLTTSQIQIRGVNLLIPLHFSFLTGADFISPKCHNNISVSSCSS